MSIVNWLFEKADPLLEIACAKLSAGATFRRSFYTDADPYFTRFYFGQRAFRTPYGSYLDYYHEGDADPAFHNHPFGWICSVVLTNGLVEERWDSSTHSVRVRVMRPGSIIVLHGNIFHRVSLINQNRGAWVFLLSGRRIRDGWGFWWPDGFTSFVSHYNFTRSRMRYARST